MDKYRKNSEQGMKVNPERLMIKVSNFIDKLSKFDVISQTKLCIDFGGLINFIAIQGWLIISSHSTWKTGD